jgi:hypothetical protein
VPDVVGDPAAGGAAARFDRAIPIAIAPPATAGSNLNQRGPRGEPGSGTNGYLSELNYIDQPASNRQNLAFSRHRDAAPGSEFTSSPRADPRHFYASGQDATPFTPTSLPADYGDTPI